jgi:tetratricopeptide (TPR) repeat protein
VRPNTAHAWWGLANLKTARFDAADTAELERHFTQAGSREDDHAALGFALAKALEDQDRYADAWRVLRDANALRRAQQPWDAAAFSRGIDAIMAVFDTAPMPAGDPALGREVIFIVSVPRSGSTLVEQIVATHPEVEGAGELPDLAAVLDEESRRRGESFSQWANQAEAQDWQRLGERYLERTLRWRARRPRCTDKSLLNWQFVGAARAMLPGARFVYCRRDPLETALSCYRQWFNAGQAFSYSIEDIGAYLRDHQRLMHFWRARHPNAIFEHVHEALLADTETSVRRLLESCGLTFDSACLDFHRSERNVRTASAAQVRIPLQRNTPRTVLYGALLDPLRHALDAG